MRVALVHDWLTGMRGGEKVLEAIARLFPQAPIHTLFHFPGTVSEELEAHPIVTSFLQRAPEIRRHYRRYLPLFPAAVESFDLTGYDLVVSTSHCVAKGAIPGPEARHVCYCHTPMRYAWDMEHAYFPRRRGPVARLRSLALSRLRTWDAASAPRVDRFVANSRFVARRIRRYYGREAEVLAPPVDVEFFRPPEERPAEPTAGHLLVVAALAPYKRVEVAVEAARRTGRELLVVGDGPELARLRRRAAGDGAPVRFLGRVEGPELAELYRGARLLLQPGVEDFGIAPVEALACGTPVVAVARGGVLDIVDDGVHGVLYQPPAGNDDGPAAAGATLAASIDKALGMSFNVQQLRARAERFATASFVERFRSLLLEAPPHAGERGHSAGTAPEPPEPDPEARP